MRSIPSALLLAASLLLVGATGCQKVSLVDDIQLTLQFFNPLSGPSDELHTPYVVGATFMVYAQLARSDSGIDGWSIVSSDPSVIMIGARSALTQNEFGVAVTATSVGSAQLSVRDGSGQVQHSTTVEVRQPDHIEVLAHGDLIVNRPAQVGAPEIVEGGEATFLIEYFDGPTQLNGNGALTVAPDASVTAHVEPTFLGVDRDWLAVTPTSQGALSVGLIVGGQTVQTLSIDSIDDSQIARIELFGLDESKAKTGDWLVVLAQAFDGAGNEVYGADYDFSVDGAAQQGTGDLYRYEYNGGDPEMLTATHGALTNQVLIHSSTGFVDSTNNVGCQAAPGSPSRGSLALLSTALGLLWIRRRRALATAGSSIPPI